jgi:GT2 family glycosyltransferase
MNNPLISVIVPTYNSSKFLEECLDMKGKDILNIGSDKG